jgi:Ca-activated chloride channel family protein
MKRWNRNRNGMRNGWFYAVLIALVTGTTAAQIPEQSSSDVVPQQMQTGSLLLKMKSGYVIATRMDTEINARVSGLAARVTVRQEFRNSGTDWVEGIYVFPLPDSAAVDHLRMHIGERYIEGEIREKEQARKEYQAAKAAGKKASLVRQERANIFTTSVANIGPGETVAIEIEYQETLRIEGDTFSSRFPVTMTPRYIPGTPAPGRMGSGWSPDTTQVVDASRITPPVVARAADHKLKFTLALNAGVLLESITSRYHPVTVARDGKQYAIALSEPDVSMDHDLELSWQPAPDAAPRTVLFTEYVDGNPYALLMMLPPDNSSEIQALKPRELLLIIDTSGSMHGTSMDQAKRALALALDGLGPTDRFNIIQFNSATSALFPASVTATTSNISRAKRFVGGLNANGGTEMRPAILAALKSPVSEQHLRQVIFITDGSVGNEDALFSLIEAYLGNARLFTVGIGSAPNSWFMRKAAEAGRGTFTLISALHEVNEKMAKLFQQIEQPQITDIEIEWPSGVTAETYPKTVPDLYKGEPIFIRARLSNSVRDADLVAIRGNSVLGSWGARMPVSMGTASPGIAALWARARIEDLLDQMRRGADETSTRESVIETALKHHLVSKYTSLVAVDKTPVRPPAAALNKEQVPGLLPYGQSSKAIFGFPATATPAGVYRFNGMILIVIGFLALVLFRSSSKHASQISN